MSGIEDECKGILRWHSKKWRLAHGDILVGMMVDRATAEQRESLTPGERRAVAVEGVKERSRFVLPITASSAAIAATVSGTVLTFVGVFPLGPALLLLAAPALLILASMAFIVSSGKGSFRGLLVALISALGAVATLASMATQTLMGGEVTSLALWLAGSLYTVLVTASLVAFLFHQVRRVVRSPALGIAVCILLGVLAAALLLVTILAALPQLFAGVAILIASILAINRRSRELQKFISPVQPAHGP